MGDWRWTSPEVTGLLLSYLLAFPLYELTVSAASSLVGTGINVSAFAMSPRHSLQRLASPSRGFSFLIHIIGIASFLMSFHYLQRFPPALADSFGGSYQFLTILGLALALVAFIFGALADLTLVQALFDVKNVLIVCAAPLEVLVSVLYWSIVLIDKNLLFPPELQLPFLPDFGFHAAPAILLTIDLLLLSPPWAIKAQGAMGISMTLAFLYWGWIELCFSHNGLCVLPRADSLVVGHG